MPLVDLLPTPIEDSCLFQFPSLSVVPGFRHAITSVPWNMSAHIGPETNNTEKRRRKVCDFLGMPFERMTAPNQIHSPHVIQLRTEDIGRGRHGPADAFPFVDGLICDIADVPVIQFSADCPLIVLVNPEPHFFGMAHASWRGTVAGIAAELVRQLVDNFGADPKTLVGGICPCAGPGEYEVGVEVRRIAEARLGVSARSFFPEKDGKLYFDMRAANLAQLEQAGVDSSRIDVASASTMTDERFYSHRRQRDAAGRFGLIAGITGGS